MVARCYNKAIYVSYNDSPHGSEKYEKAIPGCGSLSRKPCAE